VPARLGTELELRSLDKIFFSIFKSYLTQDYLFVVVVSPPTFGFDPRRVPQSYMSNN
jgi:hypothetical protein